MIYFEQKNLEDERKRSLLEFLNNRDYFNHTVSKTDVIAVKKIFFNEKKTLVIEIEIFRREIDHKCTWDLRLLSRILE